MINNYFNRTSIISKVLSANDTGETGGHQAGILIPKSEIILSFFPKLDSAKKNPRVSINFYDTYDKEWLFNFIYYNNKLFGGTRNEYRLTHMTEFMRHYKLKETDEIMFKQTEGNKYLIVPRPTSYKDNARFEVKDSAVIVLGNQWRVVRI